MGGAIHVGMGKDDRELVTAVAAHDVAVSGGRSQHFSDPAKGSVAPKVTSLVVDLLHVVDVDHQDRDRARRPERGVELLLDPGLEEPAGVDAGQRIHRGHLRPGAFTALSGSRFGRSARTSGGVGGRHSPR
jgi:hypothetical protein